MSFFKGKNMELYRIDDELEYNFYMMPKALLTEKYSKLSAEAKIAYILILDRLKISKINTWINEEKELYLLYKRDELAQILGVCKKTIVKILKEFNLIYEKRQGLGKNNLIFVYKIEDEQQCQNKNCKFYTSENVKFTVQEVPKITSQELPKNTVQEVQNLQCNNNSVSQYNKEIKELEEIKNKCQLNCLLTTDEYRMKPIIENILEIMYFSEELKINNAVLPKTIIRSKMQKLNSQIIIHMINKLNLLNQKEDCNIKNSTNFLISCLYNCITEYYLDSELMFKSEYG